MATFEKYCNSLHRQPGKERMAGNHIEALDRAILICGHTLKNRFIMAPLTRSRANNKLHAPTDLHVEYYQQRSGAGLIISEGTVVSPEAVGYVNVPGIYTNTQVERWKRVTDGVHQNGGKIFCQLWHVGRISHPNFLKGALPLAPSPINPNVNSLTPSGKFPTVEPREMTLVDIARTIDDFAASALRAKLAGFDGVEIHASNGYLFHQFFSVCSNQRTDDYGGNVENRIRFLFDVIDAISSALPTSTIGVRLNPMLHAATGIEVDEHTIPTFNAIVRKLNDYHLAYLHVTRPKQITEHPHFLHDTIAHFRALYTGTFIANYGYSLEEAASLIANNGADAVAFGRPFISNPDLVNRARNNWPLAEANRSTFYTTGAEGYTDYPNYLPRNISQP